ncbi:glycine/betaine ABC transporter substrate-binding protein [Leucobacter tenebrionis]|nr:glycine/betaine ABC transporter substrate-binding protein [Leucobacter tenebrionis]
MTLALGLSACSGDTGGSGEGELSGASITVGSKEFTESIVLGYIAAEVLENAGADVTDQTGISGSATVREALVSGEIDLYWEYTGTAWVNYFGHTAEDVPDDLFAAVAEEDAANGVAWLDQANFENSYAIATGRDFAEENGIATLSDMAEYMQQNPDDAGICAASEFINRDDGLPGLEEAYGVKFDPLVEVDLNLVYTQINEGCAFGEVTTTDARNITNDLVVLEDDRGFFVEYAGAVTLRQDVLDEYPAIAELLAPVSEELTNEVMATLNGRVDNDGEDPRDVAEEWLQEQGFID